LKGGIDGRRLLGSPASATSSAGMLTVSGGEDDDTGGGELDAEAARVCELDGLDPEDLHDLVAVGREAKHDAGATCSEMKT
jgi:hypothetical protein